MKLFLASSILLFSLLFQEINVPALKKDPLMIAYKKVFNELRDASISRKYKLPNDHNLRKDFAANPSKEGMTKVLKARGMVNAEEYVNKIFLQNSLMFEFLKKHPEISKQDQKKKMEILAPLLED